MAGFWTHIGCRPLASKTDGSAQQEERLSRMSNASSNLDLPYIMAAQAQKHVTHNEAITALDSLVQLAVVTRTLNESPAEPQEGQRYIVSDAPSGDWEQHEGEIAAYQDEFWHFHAPRAGWRV